MSHDNQENSGFAPEESWLNEQLLDNEEPNTDFIKLRMRIEIQEQWLRGQLENEDLQTATNDLRRALRDSVRREVMHEQAEQAQKKRRRLLGWPMWVGGVVAAAVALLVSMPPMVEKAIEDDSTIWLTAFEAYSTDTFGTEMSDIDGELNSFANSLVALDNPWLSDDWSSQATDYDEIDENSSGLQEKSRNRGAGAESGI